MIYDAVGNIVNDGLGNSYTYDAEKRLSSLSGNNVASYIYDAFGQRVRATTNSVSHDFIFDSDGRALDDINGANWLRGELYVNGVHLGTYAN